MGVGQQFGDADVEEGFHAELVAEGVGAVGAGGDGEDGEAVEGGEELEGRRQN